MCFRQQKPDSIVSWGSNEPKDLDCMDTQSHSYKAMPHPSGSQWSEVVPRPAGPAFNQSKPPQDMPDTEEGCQTVHPSPDHALVLYQQVHQWGNMYKKVKILPHIGFSLYVDMVHCPSHHLRSIFRSAELSTQTQMTNIMCCPLPIIMRKCNQTQWKFEMWEQKWFL